MNMKNKCVTWKSCETMWTGKVKIDMGKWIQVLTDHEKDTVWLNRESVKEVD